MSASIGILNGVLFVNMYTRGGSGYKYVGFVFDFHVISSYSPPPPYELGDICLSPCLS